jgi:hypothetical protein
MLHKTDNKLNYIYAINTYGEVCSFFDLTLLKFNLLVNYINDDIIINKVIKNKLLTEIKFIFSKKKNNILLTILNLNDLTNTIIFKPFNCINIVKPIDTLIYTNYYVNLILALEYSSDLNFISINNIFFSFNNYV